MVSNQEKVMIIRKKSVANPVKSRFAKKSQKISTHLLRVLIYSDNIISVRGTSDCNSRQLFEKRCEVVSRAGNCVADFYMENVLVVWLTGWAEWREYDEDNKKRLL